MEIVKCRLLFRPTSQQYIYIYVKNEYLYPKYIYNLQCICIIFWETYPLTANSQNLLVYDTEIYC